MECDLKSIIDLSDDELDLICRRQILDIKGESFKFKILSYDVKRVSETAIGFLGEHFFLKVSILPKKVEYTKQLKSTVEELRFFVKSLPRFSEYVKGFNAFNKEISLYQFLIPRLQDITIGVKKWAGNCFFTRKDKMLVMEDLSAKGFKLGPLVNGMFDFDHLSIALKTCARLHASSIIFEERTNISVLHHYPGYLAENAYPDDPNSIRTIGFNNAVEALVEMAKLIPKYDEEIHGKIKVELPIVLKKIFEFCIPSTKYRNVVNHGDLWGNNILFSYSDTPTKTTETHNNGRITVECDVHEDHNLTKASEIIEEGEEENEEENIEDNATLVITDCVPIDAKLVDFQLSRYAPPALDILTLIIITTNSDYREKYLDKLLNIYYEQLTKEILRHEIDIEDIIPKKQFQEACEYFHLAGLIECCLFNHLTLLPEEITSSLVNCAENFEDFIKTSRVNICTTAFQTDDNYKNRITDVLTQIIDNYILNQ